MAALFESEGEKLGKTRSVPSSNKTRASLGIDRPKITAQRVTGQFANGSGQFNTGGASANDHECHQGCPALGICLPFRGLERRQDAPTDLDSVFNGLEPGGMNFPFLFAGYW